MNLRTHFNRRALRRTHHHHTVGQRKIALMMIITGVIRVVFWTLLIAAYLLHVPFVHALYASVSFVALLSVFALLLTDWSQVAGSLAQLSAADAHHDIGHQLASDYSEIERDLARLAELQPGDASHQLAHEILTKLSADRLTGPRTPQAQ